MGAHAIGQAVMKRSYLQVHTLEAAKGPLDRRQVLVLANGLGTGKRGRSHIGAQNIDAIQCGFAIDVGLLALIGEVILFQRERKVFGHLVPSQYLTHFQRDGRAAQGLPLAFGSSQHLVEFFFGGGQQLLALASAFGRQQRIATGDQSLAGVVGVGNFRQVLLVE